MAKRAKSHLGTNTAGNLDEQVMDRGYGDVPDVLGARVKVGAWVVRFLRLVFWYYGFMVLWWF